LNRSGFKSESSKSLERKIGEEEGEEGRKERGGGGKEGGEEELGPVF
jgi:hypothetical protein